VVFRGGYLTVGQVRGVDLRLHFTLPLGLIFLMIILHDAWLVLGVAGIVVAHELGHVALARRYRLPVLSIDVTGIGGACRYVNLRANEQQESIIAWGGLLVQGCFLVAGEVAARTVGLSETLLGLHVINFIIIVLNIIPVRPFDGATAWRLFRWKNVRRWGRRGALHVRATATQRELDELEKKKKRDMLN
jgi:stage IV sporulation protein FB